MTARTRTSPGSSDGFTLVELVMALLVATVGLLGLLQSVLVAYEHGTRNRLREEAVLVGEAQMSQLRRDPRALGAQVSAPFIDSTPSVPGPSGRGQYAVARRCDAIGTNGQVLTLKVSVGWSFRHASSSHLVYSLLER